MFVELADMFALRSRVMVVISVLLSGLLLQACGQSSEQAKPKVEIKAAPKLTNDATTYANAAWTLMNQVDGLVYSKQLDVLDVQVRQPARKLSTDWRINVKMTDSVTEGKYALCRKALTSLEIWARETLEQGSSLAQKQSDYERDKQQCKLSLIHI